MFPLNIIAKTLKLLNSDNKPWQLGFGFALGAMIALTPVFTMHNLVIFLLMCIINVSFQAGILGFILFIPVGYFLGAPMNAMGEWLLVDLTGLKDFWVSFHKAPFLPFFRFNNTLTIGSLAMGLLLLFPLGFAVATFVKQYRDKWKEKFRRQRYTRF